MTPYLRELQRTRDALARRIDKTHARGQDASRFIDRLEVVDAKIAREKEYEAAKSGANK